MNRTRSSAWTCRAACIAIDACASATNYRGSQSGASGIAATGLASFLTDRRLPTAAASAVAPAWIPAPVARSRTNPFCPWESPTQWTRTTCPYCGTGCELQVGTRDGRLTQVIPVQDAPVSRGHLCVKGRYAFDFVSSPDRVTDPLVRTSSGWNEGLVG